MRSITLLSLVTVLLLMMNGCSSQGPSSAAPVAPATQISPTPTAAPPTATTAPVFARWDTAAVVKAFTAAGLEADGVKAMAPTDYGAAPMTAKEGVRFLIPSLGANNGGRILTFTTAEDLAGTQRYYVELGRQNALFFSWVYVKDNALVQINGTLPPEKAKAYELALNGMTK